VCVCVLYSNNYNVEYVLYGIDAHLHQCDVDGDGDGDGEREFISQMAETFRSSFFFFRYFIG